MADNRALLVTNAAFAPPKTDDATKLRSYHFPAGFVFGTSTSAYQIEGASNKFGRGPGIFDAYLQKFPGAVADGSNAFTACDAYNQYKGDIKMMKKMGVDGYRFGFSWSRIFPGGSITSGVNQAGVDYYNDLINELLANDIVPYVTLFHWDTPQALQDDYEGFTSDKIVEDFANYAEFCFWEFGDRVKHWFTLNESWSYVNATAMMASTAGPEPVTDTSTKTNPKPASRSTALTKEYVDPRMRPADSHPLCDAGDPAIEPYLVAHHQLLAHSAAVQRYRTKFQTIQKGKIGITLFGLWLEPLDESNPDDSEAVLRGMDFQLGWFIEPITTGDYPARMKKILKRRLPTFTTNEAALLKGSYDFLGINYYRSQYATSAPPNTGPLSYQTDSQVTKSTEKDGVPIGPMCGSQWINIYPQGIYNLMLYVKQKYNDPIIFITENGFDQNNDKNQTLPEVCNDTARANYVRDHIFNIYKAIQEGVKVQGYFLWSLIDNFEWMRGYADRMGIIHVDYINGLQRYPKQSAIWFMNFLDKGDSKGQTKRLLEGSEENNSSKKWSRN